MRFLTDFELLGVFWQTATGASGSFGALLLPVVLIAVFYFVMFLPMQRQQKKQKEMLRQLEAGQTVLTTGGIVGTIIAVNGDTLILRIKPDNLKLEVARSAVTGIVGGTGAAQPKA